MRLRIQLSWHIRPHYNLWGQIAKPIDIPLDFYGFRGANNYKFPYSRIAPRSFLGELREKAVDMRKLNHSVATMWAQSHSRKRCRRFLLGAGSENGGALVEFALVLPVLLLVVTGITTFGIALNNYMQLTQAVGIGAQALSVSRGNTTDPCNTVSSAVIAAAPYLVSTSISFTTKIYTSSSSSTSYPGTSCSSSSTTTGAAGNLTQGQAAVVTATYPCSLAVFGANYATACNLTAQITEIIQ